MKKKSAAVAMSGGYDSTLAAALLVEEGYEVVGVTLRLLCAQTAGEEGWERSCCAASSVTRAKRVAHALGIPHRVVDAEERFEDRVIRPFRKAYLEGRTPNPCVDCNAWIKFGDLLDRVRSWGFDRLATGHYVQRGWEQGTGRCLLRRGADRTKDQSYVLWRLTQEQLKSALFPVGHLTKSEVIRRVRERSLPIGDPVESQDVCFVPRGDYVGWLENQIPEGHGAGAIRDTDGHVVGRHGGIHRFTIGQRRGLGVAFGEPRYVIRIDAEDNVVIVGREEELRSPGLVARDVHFISDSSDVERSRIFAKIRYQHTPCPAELEVNGECARVRFDRPQKGVAPGQSVVFYRGDLVLGGGVIEGPLS